VPIKNLPNQSKRKRISKFTLSQPKVMKKLLLTTLLAGASSLTSHAAIIAEENFNYSASIITNNVTDSQINGANGGTGWTSAWSASNHGNAITATNQAYPELVTSGANALSKMALDPGPAAWNFGASRSFANQTGRVWGSATINFELVPGYFEFKLNETTNVNWSAKFGFNSGNIFTEHSGPGALVNTAFAPATGTTYFVAFTYDSTGTSPTTFYINPTGLGLDDEPSDALAIASFGGTNYGMSGIGQVSFFSGDNSLFTIDDIRVGTTWASVSPIPEPSAFASLAGISVLGLAALRRRRRSV